MKSFWCDQEFLYDGNQLKSLFAYLQWGVEGDSIVSWIGPCQVSLQAMADGEDRRANAEIRGSHMVHFIVEKFGISLYGAVGLQRLLSALALDLLREMSRVKDMAALVRREGDDLYVGERKLSISIAVPSFNSCLIHFAVNVVNEGTPVPTISLNEFGIEPAAFAHRLMDRFAAEERSITFATQKVRGVGSYDA